MLGELDPYSPSNTMSPGAEVYLPIASGILFHPAVWPQQTRAEYWALLCPFGEGSWTAGTSLSNIISPGPRPTSLPSGILIHPAILPQQIGREVGAAVPRLLEGQGVELQSPSNTMWPAPRPTSVPSGILIHPAVWPQETWAENLGCPFWGRGLSPHLTQCGRGRGYLHAKYHLNPSNRLSTIHQRHRIDRQTGQTTAR